MPSESLGVSEASQGVLAPLAWELREPTAMGFLRRGQQGAHETRPEAQPRVPLGQSPRHSPPGLRSREWVPQGLWWGAGGRSWPPRVCEESSLLGQAGSNPPSGGPAALRLRPVVRTVTTAQASPHPPERVSALQTANHTSERATEWPLGIT